MKLQHLLREPINGLTHWLGALKAVFVLVFLIYTATHAGLSPAAFLVFGLCMLVLYISSASYHSFQVSEKTLVWLRKLDHSAIFLMIAGTYTPIILLGIQGPLRMVMILLVWSTATAGIVLKLWTLRLPRWLSTLLYLSMGWMAIFLLPQLMHLEKPKVFIWLLVGGLFYTIGGIIYGTKRVNPFPGIFGFHEIWHLFVLGGSTAHSIMMFYLIPSVVN